MADSSADTHAVNVEEQKQQKQNGGGDSPVNYKDLVDSLNKNFYERKISAKNSYKWRVDQLNAMKKMVTENEERWYEAITKDLGRNKLGSYLFEYLLVETEIDNALANLKKWMKNEKGPVNLISQPATAHYYPEPLGTVLIISPWNFPMQLALLPLVGAIAAGNNVLLKPSEVSEHTGALLEELITKYLDQDGVRCKVEGVEGTTRILNEKWDMIFFTGSTPVGRIVMQAAAKHLTPVLLELGGKSPCYVSKDCSLETTARRLIYGKFSNCGQICIAPDYLLVDPEIEEPLVEALKRQLKIMYGDNPKESESYARIVSERRVDALSSMLKDNKFKLECGGLDTVDKKERYMPPTLLRDVEMDSAVMKEEIFGPILPIIKTDSIDTAVEFINARPKPLALYVFAKDAKVADQFLAQTSAGGVVINDCIMQAASPLMPFGGVGESGIGKYHGETTFQAFSHRKPVLWKTINVGDSKNPRYAPYSEHKTKQIRQIAGLAKCAIM